MTSEEKWWSVRNLTLDLYEKYVNSIGNFIYKGNKTISEEDDILVFEFLYKGFCIMSGYHNFKEGYFEYSIDESGPWDEEIINIHNQWSKDLYKSKLEKIRFLEKQKRSALSSYFKTK